MFRNICMSALVGITLPALAVAFSIPDDATTASPAADAAPCVVTFVNYNDTRDVSPPCQLNWELHLPAPDSPWYGDINRAEFANDCAHYGGDLAPAADGAQVWTCTDLDY